MLHGPLQGAQARDGIQNGKEVLNWPWSPSWTVKMNGSPRQHLLSPLDRRPSPCQNQKNKIKLTNTDLRTQLQM